MEGRFNNTYQIKLKWEVYNKLLNKKLTFGNKKLMSAVGMSPGKESIILTNEEGNIPELPAHSPLEFGLNQQSILMW